MQNPDPKRTSEAHVFDEKQRNMLSVVSEVAPSKLNHYRKAYAQKSLRSSITAKCLECVSFESAEVRRCTSTACPLHSVRPYQKERSHRNQTEKTGTQRNTVEMNYDDDQPARS